MNIIKGKGKFNIVLLVFVILLFLLNWASRVNSYNATILAFSYKYGFIPRAFVGTFYGLLDKIIPVDMMTYQNVNNYVFAVTLIYIVLVTTFCFKLLTKLGESQDLLGSVQYLLAFFLIFAIPTFAGYYNYGRVDLYLVLITLAVIVVISADKSLWLVPILAAIGMMIHEGYIFMYLNMVIVLLLYKSLNNSDNFNQLGEKEWSLGKFNIRRKYAVYFVITIIITLALFIYFHFFNTSGGQDTYQAIYETAKGMTYKNKPHKDLIRAEILNVDLTAEESKYRSQNFIELGIFIVLFIPFIAIAVNFFRRLINSAKDSFSNKISYIIVALGGLTTLPLFILKVDFGRWVFAVIAYYSLVILALIRMGDELVAFAWFNTIKSVRDKHSYGKLLLAYALLFVPLTDVCICKLTYTIYSLPETIIHYFS